jgi:arylsulfatase A
MNNVKSIFMVILLGAILLSCSKETENQLPNIVFILADDMGTDVFDVYGGTSYYTPNIDGLAETGLTFNQCYSAPVCSPSRVKLLTGRYGFRTGQTWGYLPPDEITFGHILKDAGYKVGISGKWQMSLLKDDPEYIKKMGFDESCVFGWHEGSRYYEPLIYQNGKIRKDVNDRFGPDVYTEFLINFIKQNKDVPFFAYFSMTLAHEVSNDLPAPPKVGKNGRYETFKENVEYADVLIGKVVNTLNDLDLRENTIIIFVGDNGTPHHYITAFENGNYLKEPVFSKVGDTLIQGGKSFLTNQGTHVPLIVNWTGKTSRGKSIDDLIDFSDFMSTIAEFTGAKLPDDRIIDGQSFAQQIVGKKGNPRDWIYQVWEGKAWIRNKDWKLYNNGNLFDMKKDPFEMNPIALVNDTEASGIIRNYLSIELTKLKSKK